MTAALAPESWDAMGACVDSGVDFFSTRREVVAKAKLLCRGCPMLHECGEYSLAVMPPIGIWGGMTPPEREAIRRKRRRGF